MRIPVIRHACVAALLVGAAWAKEVPLQRADELEATQRQSAELFDTVIPLVREASASTVWVWMNRRQVALGTVVGSGDKVLTKWSEIAFASSPIQCVAGDGRTATASVLGVYQDEDLALLQLDRGGFHPVSWSEQPAPAVGRFLVAAWPDGQPKRVGVVAVEERVLKESHHAFLGIAADGSHRAPGVKVAHIDETGGADEAGIRVGDVLLSVDGEAVGSGFELRDVLLEKKPGDQVRVEVERDGGRLELEVVLGHRADGGRSFPEARLRGMRSLGGPISVVGNGFPAAIQTDMQLRPEHCGGPVVDLDGEVIGISLARTDRTRSFILSSSRVVELLKNEPLAPEQVQPRDANRQVAAPGEGRAMPLDPRAAGRLRGHLEEMQALLERMEREMRGVGE